MKTVIEQLNKGAKVNFPKGANAILAHFAKNKTAIVLKTGTDTLKGMDVIDADFGVVSIQSGEIRFIAIARVGGQCKAATTKRSRKMRVAQVTVGRYGRRNWAVYENGVLICVTLYKCGAMSVRERLTRYTSIVNRPLRMMSK